MPTRSPTGREVRTLLTGSPLQSWCVEGLGVGLEPWRTSLARSRNRWARASPPAGSRPMTSRVSSPAMVPRMSPRSALSKALARNCAAPGGVRSTTRLALASALTSSSAHRRASRSRPRRGLAGRGDAAVTALPRHGVDEGAVGVAHLDRVELDEVAAQRGLGDADAVVAEEVGELGLGAHRVGRHDVDDPLVAGALGQRGHGRHDDRSRSQVSTAFWACRRFSASSQTTECGPSMTSSAISLPR